MLLLKRTMLHGLLVHSYEFRGFGCSEMSAEASRRFLQENANAVSRCKRLGNWQLGGCGEVCGARLRLRSCSNVGAFGESRPALAWRATSERRGLVRHRDPFDGRRTHPPTGDGPSPAHPVIPG